MLYIENKKAGLDYTFLDRFEAGIELLGQEVKSVKQKHGSLDGARVILRGGEAFLIGSYIPPYQPHNVPKNYDDHRVRKLLLTKKELSELYKESEERSLTLIPLSLYSKGVLIKCSLAVAQRKTKHDKRETLKKKDDIRQVKETFAWYDY